MSINPFDAEYFELTGQLDALKAKRAGLQSKLDEHQATSEDELRARVRYSELQLEEAKRVTAAARTEALSADQRNQDHKRQLKARWYNPVALLPNLASYLGSLDTFDTKLRHHNDCRVEEAKAAQKLAGHADALAAYLAFEAQRGGILELIESLQPAMVKLEEQLSRITPLKTALDNELRAPLMEIHQYQVQISELQHDIQQAEHLEWILQNATNGREKAQAHSQCESLFDGESKPRKVIKVRSDSIRALERKLKKNEALALEIVKRHTRVISTIVIDGSNLCYIGDEFIGLKALVTVANHLSGKYPVTVIFDGSICKKTSLSEKDIRASFAPAVTVHVMTREGKADEIVLKEATDDHAYVLSSDNYDEYRFLPAVAKGRVLKPEILKTRIYIPAMGLDLPWSA
ncbi:hypothetical protein L4Z68_001367 [Pseudomonas aeruginosa]|nr:hypothetical protein [Pseudomonas aeruginosa]EKX2969374.1 hypothetical protein [Pseudomonas aeruginosa]HBO6962746.1 hypothetical protein [Pseudomonas aeruginosa]HBO7218649.1 hypothetical protein [Pseudomonas aeruginosa]HBO8004256.1 hypothetical protein [Pseudomonas aeruginosa]